jgi:hypothetical protein
MSYDTLTLSTCFASLAELLVQHLLCLCDLAVDHVSLRINVYLNE